MQNRGEESKTRVYQTLDLNSMDCTSTYSEVHKQQTPTVERGDHMCAAAANEAYGHIGSIPVVQNVADRPAVENIPTVQNKAYGIVPDLPQKRGEESKSGAYKTLELASMDYTSLYSTIERDDCAYVAIDSTRVEPPSQYAKLKSNQLQHN